MQVAKTPRGLGKTRVNACFLRSCFESGSIEVATKALRSSEVNEFWWPILLSIAVTRQNNDWLDYLASVPTKDRDVSKSQLIDCLFVTFMFNLINEVANSYQLRPEWNIMRWTGVFRKKILQTTLPSFVRMDPIDSEKAGNFSTNLPMSLVQLELPIESEIDGCSPIGGEIWHCFNANPRVAISIQQIFFALALMRNDGGRSIADSEFKKIFLAAVTHAVQKLGVAEVDTVLENFTQQSA